MTNGDIVLLLLLAGAFIIGFVWGTARTLIFLGGSVIVFLIAAHARPPLSGFLSRQWTNLAPVYSDMISMLVLFGLGLAALTLLVWFGARNTGLSARAPDIDRLLGGLAGVACAVVVVGAVEVILALFYGHQPTLARDGGSDWSASLYLGMVDSHIGSAIHRSLLPPAGSVASALLPVGFREAFGGA